MKGLDHSSVALLPPRRFRLAIGLEADCGALRPACTSLMKWRKRSGIETVPQEIILM